MTERLTMGRYLATSREAAGLSLRVITNRTGLAPSLLCDIEHDRRRLLTEHWPAVVRAIPGVTLQGLAAAAIVSGKVHVDARALSPEHQDIIAAALVAEAEAA